MGARGLVEEVQRGAVGVGDADGGLQRVAAGVGARDERGREQTQRAEDEGREGLEREDDAGVVGEEVAGVGVRVLLPQLREEVVGRGDGAAARDEGAWGGGGPRQRRRDGREREGRLPSKTTWMQPLSTNQTTVARSARPSAGRARLTTSSVAATTAALAAAKTPASAAAGQVLAR